MTKQQIQEYLERKAEQYTRQHEFALVELFDLFNQAIKLDCELTD